MEPPPSSAVDGLRLAPVLDGKAAIALRDEILNRPEGDLVLDGSDVSRVGGLCLQVLMAARADRQAQNAGFSLVNASPDMAENLILMGAFDLITSFATEEAQP